MKLRVPGQKLYIDFQRNFIHSDVNLFLIISKEKTKTVAGKDSGVSAIHIQSRKSDIRSDTPESFPATILDFSFEIIKINFTSF
jgi:hypothetical protein